MAAENIDLNPQQDHSSQDARREGRRPAEGRSEGRLEGRSEGRSEERQREPLSETDRRRERAANMRHLNRVRRMGGRK